MPFFMKDHEKGCCKLDSMYYSNYLRKYPMLGCVSVCWLLCLLAVTKAARSGDSLAQDFFKEEYLLDYNISELIFEMTVLFVYISYSQCT